MTRNALCIEAVGRRANNVLLPHSIQAWDNDCWSNKVIEEQLDRRHIPSSKYSTADIYPPQRTVLHGLLAWPQLLNSHQRQMPCGTLNSSARVAYRAHDYGNSVSNITVKHWHGLVTDCH